MAIYAQPVQVGPRNSGPTATIVLFVSAASIGDVPAAAGAVLALLHPDLVGYVWETPVTVTTS